MTGNVSEEQPPKVEEPPPKVTCPTCLASPLPPLPPSRAVPRLTSWTEVLGVLELTQAIKSEDTHAVSELLALYELVPMVECGLPDRTPHHWGCCVRTACGLRLNIGKECGRKRVPEMSALLRADGEHKQHEARVAKMRRAEYECAVGEQLRSEVVRLTYFVGNMQAHAPSLAHELRQIARKASPEFVETNYRPGPDGKMVSDRLVVVGTQLFDERDHPDEQYLRTQIDHVRELCHEAGDTPSEHAARSACRQIDALRGIMREAEEWAGQARRFFSERNFAMALLVTSTRDVEAKGETFVTPDRYEIGYAGIHRIK